VSDEFFEARVEERTTEWAAAYGRLTERSNTVDLLRRVSVAATEACTVEGALQIALDEVCRHIEWPVGHVYLLAKDASGESLPTSIWHLDDIEGFDTLRRVTEERSFAVGEGLPGRVAATAGPEWIDDATADPNFPRSAGGEDLGVRAAFAVPMLAGKEVIGVLEFFSPEPTAADPALLGPVALVGAEIGGVVERKRVEEALRHSEARTRSILEAANDAFLGMDEGGFITEWNRSAEMMFGWTRVEAVGRSVAETIVPAAYRQAHLDGLARFLATGEGPVLGKRLELSALHRDGREFPSSCRSGRRAGSDRRSMPSCRTSPTAKTPRWSWPRPATRPWRRRGRSRSFWPS